MPIVEPEDMLVGEPLPGWHGRYFHSERMTFSLYDLGADAVPLHEHHHPEEEVWTILEGRLALSISGVESTLEAGSAAVVPPNARHSARVLERSRALVVDQPVRLQLPGSPTRRPRRES